MTNKKSLIKIVCAVLLIIFSIGLIGGFIGNIAKIDRANDTLNNNTDNSPDVPADEPDNPGEDPENPGDVPGDEEIVEAEVFYDEEYMLLNHTYDTSSEIVKTFSFTTEYDVIDDGTGWIQRDDALGGLTSDPNRMEIEIPAYTSGQYALSFRIFFQDLCPSSSMLVRYANTIDALFLCRFAGENDSLNFDDYDGNELSFMLNFDFDTNYLYFSVTDSYSSHVYEKIIDLSTINGGVRDVPFRIRYDIVDGLSVTAQEVFFTGFSFSEGVKITDFTEEEKVDDVISSNSIFDYEMLNIVDGSYVRGDGAYRTTVNSVITDFDLLNSNGEYTQDPVLNMLAYNYFIK